MSFKRIDELVTEEYFIFQAWGDRYGRGVWATLSLTESQADTVRELSDAGDLDTMPAMDYVFSADWLPYVTGRNLEEAMQTLEVRLASLPRDQLHRGSLWAGLVHGAIEALEESTRGRSYYSDNQPTPLDDLPATFELAVARLPAVNAG